MVKYYQWQDLLPLFATIFSAYLIITNYENRVFYYFGLFFVVVGLIFWWVAKMTLGDAFGIFSEPKRLVTNGIYSKFRNPIYLGLCLTFIGFTLLIRNKWVYLITFFVIVSSLIRVKLEEKELLEKFNENYVKYKKKTWF